MTAVNENLIDRARGGDERAFQELTEPHRREIQFHCYRMLGSLHDAEDMLQETLVAAWRNLAHFEQRASVRTWLYKIATNRCLNTLRDAGRRPPTPPVAPFQLPPASRNNDPTWLGPYPDDEFGGWADPTPGPDAHYEARESVEIAFVAALQRLTGRQRAALMLHDVLGFRSREVAEMLESSEESVKGALKRARATLDAELGEEDREPMDEPDSPAEKELVKRFVDAFVADDVERLVSLLTDRAWLSMPPATVEYQGPEAVARFLNVISEYQNYAPVVVLPGPRANGHATIAAYRVKQETGLATAVGLILLRTSPSGITRLTWFLGPTYGERFGMPASFQVD
jgi:RNA polymerase sigma-70 factor (TIGR02960 family)